LRIPWLRFKERAKLENFTFHSLRHSCASFMAQAGCTLQEIAVALGHSGMSSVLVYAHLCDKSLRKAREAGQRQMVETIREAAKRAIKPAKATRKLPAKKSRLQLSA
jgi:integrase